MKQILLVIVVALFSMIPTVVVAESLSQTELLSEPLKVDKIFRSMLGPQSSKRARVGRSPRSVYWIRGFEVELVNSKTGHSEPPEFMCHANLEIADSKQYAQDFNLKGDAQERVVTLSQGQSKLLFPKGFGFPVLGKTNLLLFSQVLNLNEEKVNKSIQQKVKIYSVRDQDRVGEIKPLMAVGAMVMVATDKESLFYGVKKGEESALLGAGCAIAEPANKGGHQTVDQHDNVFSGHWMVPPGRHTYHSNVTRFLHLEYDTTVHYIAVHLHPFAESIELIDLTAKKTVFKSLAVNFKDRIGLKKVDFYSDETGLPLFKNHEYQMKTIYNNTSKVDQDAMAAMYMFVHNKKFKSPL